VWAKANFPGLFKNALLPIVMSHAGMKADRDLLLLAPRGTLFAGAHDHLKLVRPMAIADVYFQSGSWLDCFSLAQLRWTGKELHWQVSQVPVKADDSADPELDALVRRVSAKYLSLEDQAPVAHLSKAWSVEQAGSFSAASMAKAVDADVGFIGNTTFGAGLPAGTVRQIDFDGCLRFDGTVYTAHVDGKRLRKMLGESTLPPLARFDLMAGGEFCYSGGQPGTIDEKKSYMIATTDWGAKNSARYFSQPVIEWTEHPTVKVKAAVLAALAKAQ
jgi:2',3'-cyclic-nucleotide 2'-phosphodiesterase (5'-nucleotidase family)